MKRFLPYVPAILLCVVAIVQVQLSRTRSLSPWKGGGFGMFSTNDDEYRRIEVWVEGPEGEREIDVSRDLRVMQVAAYPTADRLRSMGRRIGEVQRDRGAEVDRVRVVASRTDFDPTDLRPERLLIREVVISLDGRSR